MGTWGYEPKDNDNTGDMVSELDREHCLPGVDRIVLRKLPRGGTRWSDLNDKYERVGVVQAVLERGGSVSIRALRYVESWLEACIASPIFAGTWRSPDLWKKTAKAMLKAFWKLDAEYVAGMRQRREDRRRSKKGHRRFRRCRGSLVIRAPPGWPHTSLLRKEAAAEIKERLRERVRRRKR